MFAGREAELSFLNTHYENRGNAILVLYGRKGVGKTALLTAFTDNKPFSYYVARSCSAREQCYQWSHELKENGHDLEPSDFPSYENIFHSALSGTFGQVMKPVLILDEFHHLIKNDPEFMPALIHFVYETEHENGILVVLSSSASGWIENSMVSKMGRSAKMISGLLKLREMKLSELSVLFSEYSDEDRLKIFGILGGNPGLWKSFTPSLTFDENCIRNLLTSGCRLQEEMSVLLSEELRETSVYNTILSTMSGGICKMNDLFLHTGFSRAKISVYLKNLMELDLVEKIASFESDGYENTQKGIYRIASPYVRFYYHFIYSNFSKLQRLEPEYFYHSCVRPDLNPFIESAYKLYCKEKLMQTFPVIGEWIGKRNCIDLVCKDSQGRITAVICRCCSSVMVQDYLSLTDALDDARISVDKILIFGEAGYSEQLGELAQRLPMEFRTIIQRK